VQWAAQGGGGVTDPEGVKECLDVVLDWVILWVFSNLSDSMIL